MKTYRKPIANGVYYKASKIELNIQIKKLFLDSKFGPKSLPQGKKTDEFKAFIVPHNYYDKSGYCAAHAYKKIFENADPETIVILGPDHDSFGCTASIFPSGAFITPLGEAEVDEAFNDLLIKEKVFTPDEFNHSDEYSIEMQLPIMQYYYGDKMPKIVPILLNSNPDNKELKSVSQGLFNAWMKSGKRVLFLVSTNFSHVGLKHGFIPYPVRGKELNDKVKKVDKEVADKICKMQAKSALTLAKKNKLNICGLNSIIVLIELLKLMKKKKIKGEVLSNYSSADLNKDYDNFIDYFAIEFK